MIRLYNAKIMSMKKGVDIIDGEVDICGNKISYIGKKRDNNELKYSREIDLTGKVIMPGFKNMHTHSAMTFLRSNADDMPLLEWLNKQIFPMEAKLRDEHVYILSKLAIMEYLASGITTNFDMYMFEKAGISASIDCGFRTVLCSALNNFYSNVDELEENYIKFNNVNPLITDKLGFHAEYTASEELIKGIAKVAEKYEAPVYTHCSEGKPEVVDCINRTGLTPVQYLDKQGIFNYGGGIFHGVHLTDKDIEILKDKKVSIITNPASNAKLASGIAELNKYYNAGINLAIGTDGPASNNALNMFREMYLTTILQKLLLDDPSVMNPEIVLNMAINNGAKSVGLNECDYLDEGKLADITVLDLEKANMQPINNIAKNIVYAGNPSNVYMTIVDGKILYEDGNYFIGEKPEYIYKESQKIIDSMR